MRETVAYTSNSMCAQCYCIDGHFFGVRACAYFRSYMYGYRCVCGCVGVGVSVSLNMFGEYQT